jgi:hypothetical protein
MLVEGTTIFNTSLTRHDEWKGQSTGKFSVQVKLDGKTADKLNKAGVNIKEYDGEPLRKFTSKYAVEVWANNKERYEHELPSGTKVRVEYTLSKQSDPEFGFSTYLKRILILEMGEGGTNSGDPAFFADEPQF